MNRKPGEKLFTIEFSSSYDYEYDEPPIPAKKQPTPQKHQPMPAKVIKTTISNDDLTEYSDEPQLKIKKTSLGNDNININNNNNNINHINNNNDNNNQNDKDIFTILDAEQKNHDNANNENNSVNAAQPNLHMQNSQPIISNNQDLGPDTSQPAQITPPPRQSLPVRIPPQSSLELNGNQQQKNNQNIYIIRRETKAHLNGRRLFFYLLIGEIQAYVAKVKTKNASHVYIMKGKDVHLGSSSDAVILIGNDGSDFSLRLKEDLGDEILTIRISPPKTTADTSRRMTVSFFSPLEGTPKKIFTKNPGLNSDGKIEHDFEGKAAIESIKNAVLVTKPEGPNLMYIRKTGKDDIEIEAKFPHNDLWIFAIGIASFMSKVKGSK